MFRKMNQYYLIFAVAAGGALGAMLRYAFSVWISSDTFPYATLAVNILGSFLFGFLFLFIQQLVQADWWRHFVLVGFLGSLTTFSSFSYQTIDLFNSGRLFSGILNIFISLVSCLVFTSFGIWLSKKCISS